MSDRIFIFLHIYKMPHYWPLAFSRQILGRSYLLWTCQIILKSQKQMVYFGNQNGQGKKSCVLVLLDLRIKVNFHCDVCEAPKRHTVLRCTSIPLGVFLHREKISLLNGSMSSPSPSLYSLSGLGREWKMVCLQFCYLLFGHFPLSILGCVFFLGGGEYLFVPTAKFRDSIKLPTTLRGFFSPPFNKLCVIRQQ